MKIYELNDHDDISHMMSNVPKAVAAIGFFDGVHLGHQALIKRAVDYAKEHDVESAVVTFYPHPSVVLNPDNKDIQYITPTQEKEKLIEQMGVDRLYIISFTRSLARLSPEEFINRFMIGLNIKHLIAGFDFSFGYKGAANMKNIHQYVHDRFTYETVGKIELADEKVSSTRIRSLLAKGDVEAVETLLNRPFVTTGTVIHGFQRGGSELGYPTANIELDSEALLPKTGVYGVKIRYDEAIYYGMASLGFNPTFKDNPFDLKFEVHIFDFNGDLYGKTLDVEWKTYIRDEYKFDNVETLMAQLEKDEQTVRSYFNLNK